MSYGPNPWHQQHWDARAATNFMAGGAGSGLIVCTALAGISGLEAGTGAGTAPVWPGPWPFVLGAALVGLGLFAVWLEIGRPLRALNVFLHPKTSWMTREAFAGATLMAAVLASLLWPSLPALSALAGLAALAFVYCQGRILRAARGIPAWREPLVMPLVVATGLAEGAGLWALLHGGDAPRATLPTTLLLLAALLARLVLWPAWRSRLTAAPRALKAIDAAGRIFRGSTLAALALVAVALLAPPVPLMAAALPLAGLLALAGGQWFKFTLLLRGAFNQGFALPHLPVRGVPHVRPDVRPSERR